MFVRDDDLIEIKIHYRKAGYRYLAYTVKEYDALKEEEKVKLKPLCVKMKELTWGLYNELQEKAMIEDGAGDYRFNFKIYKENRLKQLIKEWDAVSEENKSVSINESSIAHLSPAVAEAILRAYDEISFVSEEEEGKL